MIQHVYLHDGPNGKNPLCPDFRPWLERLFGDWVVRGGAPRDFLCALTHETHLVILEEKLSGLPAPTSEVAQALAENPKFPPCPVLEGKSPAPGAISIKEVEVAPVGRFYTPDMIGSLHTGSWHPTLRAVYAKWVSSGFLVSELVMCLSQSAYAIEYDYDIACSMGGMGGCKTAHQFLTQCFSI